MEELKTLIYNHTTAYINGNPCVDIDGLKEELSRYSDSDIRELINGIWSSIEKIEEIKNINF